MESTSCGPGTDVLRARSTYRRNAARQRGDVSVISPTSSTSWQPAIERDVLERLRGEARARGGGQRDACEPVTVEAPGCAAHVVQGARLVEARSAEQVLAVDEQLAPAVAGHGHDAALPAHEAQRGLGERLLAQLAHDLVGRARVEDPVARIGVRAVERELHDVGQGAGGPRPLDARDELVLADGDDPHLDAGRARERGDVGDRRPDAIGLVLPDPEGDALLRALLIARSAVVVAAAARRRERQHRGGDQRAASSGHDGILSTRATVRGGRVGVRRDSWS